MLVATRIALTNRMDFIIVMAQVALEIMAITVFTLGRCPRFQDYYSDTHLESRIINFIDLEAVTWLWLC